MIERTVYANRDSMDFPIKVYDGPEGLADPKDSVCIDMTHVENAYAYIDKEQWYELARAVDQWFKDAEADDNAE
jgi:hypothetical protein